MQLPFNFPYLREKHQLFMFVFSFLHFVVGCKNIWMSRASILLDMDAQHALEILGIWMNLLLLLFQKMVSLRLYSNCDINNGWWVILERIWVLNHQFSDSFCILSFLITCFFYTDILAAAVLSGNRNFEGRVHPLTRANYLASPPLVVAYALAGTVCLSLKSVLAMQSKEYM